MLPEWAQEEAVGRGSLEQGMETGDDGPAAAVDRGERVLGMPAAGAGGSLAYHHAHQEV